MFKTKLLSQNLVLDASSALYWDERKMLIISDLHFGKAAHFRKNGIPISGKAHMTDLQRLNELQFKYSAKTMLFLGDIFHSDLNNEWNLLQKNLQDLACELILIKGNHDILDSHYYHVFTVMDSLNLSPFSFVHDPMDLTESKYYKIAGHVHPSVRIPMGPRQSRRYKCFFFGENYALVPSFGVLTGNYIINYDLSVDKVFVIAENTVLDLGVIAQTQKK